jgi:hypothetical protein
MRRRILVATAAVAVAAVPLAIRLARPSERGHHAHRRDDSRRRGPGIHRAGPAELALRDRVAREESAKIENRRHAGTAASALPSVPATTWVNLGPTDAPEEINYLPIAGVDSGRPNNIVVDPRDPDVVYVAVSGGGIWKTYDFLSASPHWNPAFDTRPNLAVGALAIDPFDPDTLYAGMGDFVDGSGDTIQTTHDGGSTWSDPVQLTGTYASGTAAHVGAIRSIGVQGGRVLVATDAGLFMSNTGGADFALLDLPNVADRILSEAIWSVVPTGQSSWVAVGEPACDIGMAPPGLFGFDPASYCTYGNNTNIWRSDDGVTWSLVPNLPQTTGVGRATLAAGPVDDPLATVVYAFVGTTFGDRTAGFWRSQDGGRTWLDATGVLANPSVAYDDGTGTLVRDCGSMDVGHNQSWYNQAIVVDPTNADHVLVGGNLCGVRTLNGTAAAPTWELVSHWLPGPEYGATQNGVLPYVHADWHTATSVFIGGTLRTIAGTDGGVFVSTNVFDPATAAEQVTWVDRNRGLATHLMYSVASGDPVTANPFVLYAGLQDNGTRFRADPHHPSYFNQPIGGDGIGAVVHASSSGTTYWASVEYGRAFCKPAEADCSVEVPRELDDTLLHWHFVAAAVGPAREDDPDDIAERVRERLHASGEDSEPFLIHYANVETDTAGQSVLTHSDGQVFVSVPSGTGFTWASISQDLSTTQNQGFANVVASRTIPDLYGAVGTASAAPVYVTTQGNVQHAWTAARSVRPLGAGPIYGPSSLDFPPVLPAGTQPGQVFIGAFSGTMYDASFNQVPPPDDKGRLYRTSDFGLTWTSIVGADPAHRLPNVPVYVVKYDPMTPTTIYAGTDVGVYLSLDDGATWDRMGDGLPVVPVRDIYIAKNQEFIRVATYGRGLWEIYPSAAENPGAPGNGDYDRNLKIDWVDVAAMSSRLGVTPGTQAAPFYSWILDMTGGTSDPPLAAIDEADLDSLLAVFGGHP